MKNSIFYVENNLARKRTHRYVYTDSSYYSSFGQVKIKNKKFKVLYVCIYTRLSAVIEVRTHLKYMSKTCQPFLARFS